MTDEVRVCRSCKLAKPLTPENFYLYKRKGRKPLFDVRCAQCERARRRANNNFIVLKFPASFAAYPWGKVHARKTHKSGADAAGLSQEAAR